jgi:hypothetical protein
MYSVIQLQLNSDNFDRQYMNLEQRLQKEIDESRKWLDCETEDSTYKRDLQKRIELINWVLENMNNPDIQVCNLIEY